MGRGNDDEATFWHAVALTAEGAATEAIRELDPLQNVPELSLAVNAALINAHRTAKAKGAHTQHTNTVNQSASRALQINSEAKRSFSIFCSSIFLSRCAQIRNRWKN